jgi:hypothetical protein
VEGGENDVFPSPSKGHQAWNLPRATKHWNLPLAHQVVAFFPLFFKGVNLDHLFLFFLI